MIKIVNKVFIFSIGLSVSPFILSNVQIYMADNKNDQNLTKIQTLLNEEFLVFYKDEVTDWNNPKIIQDVAYNKVLESVNWLTWLFKSRLTGC